MARTPAQSPLSLRHDGFSSIHLEADGLRLHFDPLQPPVEGTISVLTWNETERLQGVLESVLLDERPRVVAGESLLSWLRTIGPVDGYLPPVTLEGAHFEAQPYPPIPYATPSEGLRKLRSTLRDPVRAAGRLWARLWQPSSPPYIVEVRLPDGERLLHLNCALHRWTEDRWLEALARRCAGAALVLAGVDFGEEQAFVKLAARLEPRALVVTDLVGDIRRQLELTTAPLEPVVEALREKGVPARLLPSGGVLRLEA